MKISQQIIAEIVRDITGRSGLGDEFEQIDDGIQAEIIEKWEGIVTKRFALLIEDKTQNEIAEEILEDFHAPRDGETR